VLLLFLTMKLLQRTAIAALFATSAVASSLKTAPKGCLKLPTDSDWPAPEVWKAQLPGVIPKDAKATDEPDYRIRPKTAAEVQRAVKFAKDNNVRLSVITSGHGKENSLTLLIHMLTEFH
jgi:FAD/FMN-containing dehydrogenase